MFTKFKEWKGKSLTIGLWRPIEVERGFIQDYIMRSGYSHKSIILF